MTDSAPALNDPFAVLTGPLAATTRMQLEVVDSAPLSPGMQRLVLTAPELAGPPDQPGQGMILVVAVALPPGRGHAYLAGEATVVLRLRETLAARGLAQEQISPKAYWGRGRANASHGEPARDG